MAYSFGSAGRIGDARSAILMRRAGVASALVLIGLGLLIPEPIVFAWRHTFSLALVASGLTACIVWLLAGHGQVATLFAAGAAFALWQDAKPWIDQREVLGRSGSDIVEIGRHFVVGYEDGAEIRELVRTGRVGGIFVTRRNVAGRRIADVAAEIARLQEIRR
jgi:beta-N-acetylhexosaminidase